MPKISFKAPYAALAVILVAGVSAALMMHGGVDVLAFKVGSVFMGGLVVRSGLAIAVGAFNTAFLMLLAAMGILIGAVYMMDTTTFTDSAIEGAAIAGATGVLVALGEFLKRHDPA